MSDSVNKAKKKKKNKRPGKRDRELKAEGEEASGAGAVTAGATETAKRTSDGRSQSLHAHKRQKAPASIPSADQLVRVPDASAQQWAFAVDYNDHFETPLQAFSDLLPYLQKVGEQLSPPKAVSELVLYDPYWCQGRMCDLLHSLGVRHILNENRDFYADIAAAEAGVCTSENKGSRAPGLPQYDVLVTNPPYSGDHKARLLAFLSSPLAQGKPFALLLPAYTAGKAYWRSYLSANPSSGEAYLLPAGSYEYTHPAGTGHAAPPFFSAWFLGRFPPVDALRSVQSQGITLVGAVSDLVARGHVVEKRLNPKQRRKQQNKHDK